MKSVYQAVNKENALENLIKLKKFFVCGGGEKNRREWGKGQKIHLYFQGLTE